jgi:hypothetical protein
MSKNGLNLSESVLLLLLLVSLAGFVVVLVTDSQAGSPQPRGVEPTGEEDRSIENNCMEIAYGDQPRISVSADTTILRMDLDEDRYTVAQANLFITRALRRCGCGHTATYERPDGGLSFVASYPDGRPLRLELVRL